MQAKIARILTVGVFAGVAGGIAEVAWISLYAAATGSDAAFVARGVTETLRIDASAPVMAGIAIHMGIAAMLGMALAAAFAPLRLEGARLYAVLAGALACVWAVNFMIVLPLTNPAFVAIVPLAISFVSKLSFGLAAAACLQFSARFEHAAVAVPNR
jgi:hypothetical protein